MSNKLHIRMHGMRISTRLMPALLVVVLLTITPSARAQIFKCLDGVTGKITFTDVACPDKGTGDYIPVELANGDSGYPSSREIAASERERTAKARARIAERDRMAAEQDINEQTVDNDSIAAHWRKVERLKFEAEMPNSSGRRLLNRQIEAEIAAARAAEQGLAEVEEHYNKSSNAYQDARDTSNGKIRSAAKRRAITEQNAGRAAAGLPPLVEPLPPPRPPPTVITNCDPGGCGDNVGNRYTNVGGDTYSRSDGKTCQGVGGSMHCN